jgi:hypothetical protein
MVRLRIECRNLANMQCHYMLSVGKLSAVLIVILFSVIMLSAILLIVVMLRGCCMYGVNGIVHRPVQVQSIYLWFVLLFLELNFCFNSARLSGLLNIIII